MSQLIQLVYISHSVEFETKDSLNELLSISRRNNTQQQLSGMLLYHNHQFFQVLEGPEHKVLSAFERIKKDPRHRACRKMLIEKIDQREFSHWSMGYLNVDPSDLSLVRGLNTFMQQAKLTETDQHSTAYDLLNQFKQKALSLS